MVNAVRGFLRCCRILPHISVEVYEFVPGEAVRLGSVMPKWFRNRRDAANWSWEVVQTQYHFRAAQLYEGGKPRFSLVSVVTGFNLSGYVAEVVGTVFPVGYRPDWNDETGLSVQECSPSMWDENYGVFV